MALPVRCRGEDTANATTNQHDSTIGGAAGVVGGGGAVILFNYLDEVLRSRVEKPYGMSI